MELTPIEPPEDDDAILMQRAGGGDQAAFETLVRRHQRPLLNFFLRLGVKGDAEDLVQQTFVRLYRYRDRYRPTAKLTTFLYILARQVRVDDLRKQQRRQRLRNCAAEQAEIEASTAAPTGVGTGGLTDELQQALGSLSQRHRDVVTLGVLQELEYAEIAKILKIPVGTVKSRMFTAMRQLRRVLENSREQKDHE